jgi:hypothetical protein
MTKNNRSAVTRSNATIADVLHLAADKYLAADNHHYDTSPCAVRYSCVAVCNAAVALKVPLSTVFQGLRAMGCDTTSSQLFKVCVTCGSNGQH